RFRGFVYHRARFTPDHKSIEVSVRPRQVRPRSVRAAISRRLATTNSPSGALSSSLSGGSSSSFATPCGASIAGLRRHCGGRSALGRRQTHPDQGLYALPGSLGAPPFLERNGSSLSYFLGRNF